jgi:hypothetical protein
VLKHFIIKEFVPPEVWEREAEKSLNHIDERIIITADQVWEHFNNIHERSTVTINNWCYGGEYKYRGFRPASCTVDAKKSMHREIDGHKCGAIDFGVEHFTAKEVRDEIMSHPEKFPHITRLEDNVPWVHADIKKTGRKGIYLFKV